MRLLSLSAILALLLDQVSKIYVVHILALSEVRAMDVFPPLLNFRYGENRGVNFGLLNGDLEATRWILIIVALAICGGVAWWVQGQQPRAVVAVSAGFLIGGALGNVVDRALYGYVLDFVNMSCCGINNPFVFNVGDIFIFAGAIGLVFFTSEKDDAADS